MAEGVASAAVIQPGRYRPLAASETDWAFGNSMRGGLGGLKCLGDVAARVLYHKRRISPKNFERPPTQHGSAAMVISDPHREHSSIEQLCPSVGQACGVGNFAQNMEQALRDTGVNVRTVTSFLDVVPGDLLVQHEFALYQTPQLKSLLAAHQGRRFLFAHSPGSDNFAEYVDGFITLCDGMVRTSKPQIVLPHPGWHRPLLERSALKAKFDWSGYTCVVGTNGFISPSRQYDQIALRLGQFAARHNVLVVIMCPRHGSHDDRPGYKDQERRLVALQREFPQNLKLEIEFLEQDALNERMQACDLLWCWTAAISKPYGSGTCSDQYASGTRLVVAQKQQHGHVFGLPNVVVAPPELGVFVERLKLEVLRGNFQRHDPTLLSWRTFALRLTSFMDKVPHRPITGNQGPTTRGTNGAATSTASANGSLPGEQPLTPDNAASAADLYLTSIAPYRSTFDGKGIVICAGGPKYNTCAWVLIRMLRKLGCHLPIEVWCYSYEGDAAWRGLVGPFGVAVREIARAPSTTSSRLAGWQLKPLAILESGFREVLLLDADNVPVQDPTFLFACPEYKSTGAVFWPDRGRTAKGTDQWRVFGIPYRDEPEQESGQVLVDKSACWQALNLCAWYNKRAGFFYRYTGGDKDTFRVAWRRTGTRFAMPGKGVEVLPAVLLQHDFNGNVLFQHRFRDKWSLFKNRRVPGFRFEDECLEFIDDLRVRWSPVSHSARPERPADAALVDSLAGVAYRCIRPGHSRWRLTLGQLGAIAQGSAHDMAVWWVANERLIFGTAEGVPRYEMESDGTGGWVGRVQPQGSIVLRLVPESAERIG